LEINGVFVFQQTLKNFCRGYSLFDTEFPIIIVNSSEATDTGKNFTLFHELSHLLHSMGGISNEYTYQSINQIEVTCNKLASLILVDNEELIQELKSYNIDPNDIKDNQLQLLSKEFKVSQEVILRKLLDLNMASQSYYSEKRKQWLISVPKTRKSKGGDHFNIKLSKLGHYYSSLVLKNMYNGKISRYQASEFLNTKINYIPKLEKLIFR
jgi:Zn-dependent peptidase ImmA (M78 family)